MNFPSQRFQPLSDKLPPRYEQPQNNILSKTPIPDRYTANPNEASFSAMPPLVQKPRIKVLKILKTASHDHEDTLKSIALKASQILRRPISPEQYLKDIKTVLTSPTYFPKIELKKVKFNFNVDSNQNCIGLALRQSVIINPTEESREQLMNRFLKKGYTIALNITDADIILYSMTGNSGSYVHASIKDEACPKYHHHKFGHGPIIVAKPTAIEGLIFGKVDTFLKRTI